MFIKNITIDHFETVDHYESPFRPDVTVVGGKDRDAVFKAIGVILKNGEALRSVENIRDDTSIKAEVEVGGVFYRIAATGSKADKTFSYTVFTDAPPPQKDFFHAIEKNEEEERLSWFWSPKEERYSERLQRYIEKEGEFSPSRFWTLTSGIGMTKTFRARLNAFLKAYRPERFMQDENRSVKLLPSGRFVVENRVTERKAPLSQSERNLFELFCFFKVNEFWEEIEAIRNFRFERTPILISEPFDGADAADFLPYLQPAKRQNRQIFIGIGEPRGKRSACKGVEGISCTKVVT